MKLLYALSSFVLGCLVVLGIWQLGDARRAPLPTVRSPEPAEAGRIGELERELAELTRVVQALRDEVAMSPGTARSEATAPPSLSGAPGELGSERDPLWYLQQYVASFRNGGEGSEYFRLAVDAYLPALLSEVRDLVANAASNAILRRKLVEMLGDARFREHPVVVKLLLDRLGTTRDEELLVAVVAALEVVASEGDLPRLEKMVWSIRSATARRLCLDLIVRLAGERVNEVLLALFRSAPDDEARVLLVALIRDSDLEGALAVFEPVSRSGHEVRLQGAHRVGEFRSEAFIAFVGDWISYEPDETIRRILGEAQEQQKHIPNHHPLQMTGPPNVPAPFGDDVRAWASPTPDAGTEWVEVRYPRAFRASSVRIHETCTAGAVSEVHLIEESGERHLIWSGTDPTATPGVFAVDFSTTSYAVKAVRIHLATNRAAGWNEIDAVELVGPGDRSWATGATASGYYGAGSSGGGWSNLGHWPTIENIIVR